MTLQEIKKTKRYGRMDARTDNVKIVYPPQTKFAGSITNIRLRYSLFDSSFQKFVMFVGCTFVNFIAA